MEAVQNSTKASTFSSLPISIQLDILRATLSFKWQKQVRLVCADWYHLINFIAPPSFSLSRYSQRYKLAILRNTLNSKIECLNVYHFTLPIPILSSTRMEIPHSKKLQLGEGISSENILLLLRYYAKHCDCLSLFDLCFQDIYRSQMKEGFWLGSIKQLHFQLILMNSGYTSITLWQRRRQNHVLAISEFLQSCHVPNLNAVSLDIHIIGHPAGTTQPDEDLLNLKFYADFADFLRKYRKQVTSLQILLFEYAVVPNTCYKRLLCGLDHLVSDWHD